jgi:outer membrane usher protein
LGRREDVTGWNIDVSNAPAEKLQNVDHIRLSALPGISARFDGVTLTIEAAGSAFQGTLVDMQKKSALSIDGGKGAYINYDLSSFASRGQRTVSGASVEAVLYADNLSLASNGIFSNAHPGRQFVRYESNLRWDFPEKVQSLVVGDAIARSGNVARAFRFGGISFGTNFATRPDIVTYPLPHVPGESRLPTSAELLINGQTNSRFDLAPGPFEISNVPAINGAGEVQLVTRDALGRQQVIVLPYYVSPSLLREGLTDAGFEIGKVREDFGRESFRYRRYFSRGQFRHGLNAKTTIEGFTETDGHQHVAGGSATMTLGKFAVASTAIALSEGNTSGRTISASVERSSREFSFGLRGQYVSGHFAQIGEVAGLRHRISANAGVSMGPFGNATVIHVTESRVDRGAIATTAFNYQKQIGKTVSVLANFSTTRSDEGSHHFAGVALVIPLDTLASASVSSTRRHGISETVIDARQNLPTDEGWAARARLTNATARSARLDSGLTLQNSFGQFSADASYARGSENVRLGMNGSLVMAGGLLRAVRQLGDAFAIVSLPGYPGIDVFHDNQRVATTDASGHAIVARLRPFEANGVALDLLKLSLSTELSAPRRIVTPPRRAGAVLQFKATQTHGALVSIRKENGEPVPVGALVSVTGGPAPFPVATNGQAWVTGLDAETDATVEWRDQRCTVRIPTPDRSKPRPRIGPLTCRAAGP